jgi:hypothetical protein
MAAVCDGVFVQQMVEEGKVSLGVFTFVKAQKGLALGVS